MKKLWLTFILILVIFLQLGLPVISPAASFYNGYAPPETVAARGAATPDELANSVLLAIQENNVGELNAFLLSDEEIVLVKSQGSEDLKAYLESITATDLQNNFRRNYQNLIAQGLSQTIKWSDYSVSEARLGEGSAKNKFLQPLTVTLTDKQNRPLELALETIKLNNRYFLFRQIELKPQKKI